MIIELHILQNFAPSCLNRDDTGAPKECEFGGYRRARISSQCIKRAIRRDSVFQKLMEANGGVRTKQLIPEIAKRLTSKGVKTDKLSKLVSDIFDEAGISSKGEDERTDILFFIDKASIDKIVDLFHSYLSSLEKGNKETRSEVIKTLGEILVESVRVPDIALFGRMLAINPDKPLGKRNLNIDAACQVAHAISTNKVNTEFDYFTAVDDLQPEEQTGAGMVGTMEFNSACYYRYANVDLGQLKNNLNGDAQLARQAWQAFLRAAVLAVPTGKQTSMSAQNPPDFVFAVVREHGAWSLANAFAKPVYPDKDNSLVQQSVVALVSYWNKLAGAYDVGGIKARPAFALTEAPLNGLEKVENMEALITAIDKALTK
ncbi:MAG: type I-E CRISPR-associated protein Cas7/Cse4/CasC [Chloroflexi bacterium]|nr:type I-E CRISPR-associated protein Cas7/Cse4/CasC [Chloroflexota bacterium]